MNGRSYLSRDVGIPDKLFDAGIKKIVEVAGWQTRGSANFYPKGHTAHHTAGPSRGNAPSLGIVINGRKGIQGPLANVLQGRDNTIYVIAAGRANHAGKGTFKGLVGNSSVYGNEIENTGYSQGPLAEPWRPDQFETAARVASALCGPIDLAHFHKEWAPRRKIDPHTWSGVDFRQKVAYYRRSPRRQPPQTNIPLQTVFPKGPDMYIAVDGVGFFAQVGGVTIPLEGMDLKAFSVLANGPKAPPTLVIPRGPQGMVANDFIKKTMAQTLAAMK